MQINFDELFQDRILATPKEGKSKNAEFNFDPNISKEALQAQLRYALVPQSYRKSILNSYHEQTKTNDQSLSTPSPRPLAHRQARKATQPEIFSRKNKQKEEILPTHLRHQLEDWRQLKEKPTIDKNSKRLAQARKLKVPRKKFNQSTCQLNFRKKSKFQQKYQQSITKSFYERLQSDLERRRQKTSFVEQSKGLIDMTTGTRLFRPTLTTILK